MFLKFSNLPTFPTLPKFPTFPTFLKFLKFSFPIIPIIPIILTPNHFAFCILNFALVLPPYTLYIMKKS